ncbi:isocitrate/isopropylmalate dehydrogenase family protein [Nonomuraea sp. M3C6]|uniref:Isocitrate/isopropylmalate dehydrogenase family protein n=1 Tax=Nonomuraea marmarensis TaxID=3351344 RepID=A0ABW7AHZ1_9ACTN
MDKPYRVGYMLGDGIGPEIVPAARLTVERAVAVAGAPPLEWVELPMGASALEEHGSPMPAANKKILAECDGWLLGPHDSASYPKEWLERLERPPGGELRHFFDLYANLRPSRNRPGVSGVVGGVDLVTVRENTEGFYVDRNMVRGSGEFMPTPDTALVVGVFTRKAIRRIAVTAFELARTRRRHVTVVHKSNVIPLAFGLFVEECEAVGRDYPDVRLDAYLFDAMTAHLVRHPQDFDVIVAENMFGDTLSDLAGELVGGLGMSAALNAGDDHAMAQAAHGSAPDIAGQGISNPVGMMLSSAMLLTWMGTKHADPRLHEAATRIENAVDLTLENGPRTGDLGGSATTVEFAEAVEAAITDA